MQVVPQSVCPLGQVVVQAPLTQVWPVVQAFPQLPQFFGSVEVSTHLPEHEVCVPLQVLWHVPAEQAVPLAHTLPQAPQSFAFV